MLSGLTQSETWKQTRPNILPKKYKKLENSIDSLISDRSVSQMRIPLMKSCPFLTHHSPPDSAPVRKMANKEYFILRYFQRIRKLHYLLLHSFTGRWNISSSLEHISYILLYRMLFQMMSATKNICKESFFAKVLYHLPQ